MIVQELLRLVDSCLCVGFQLIRILKLSRRIAVLVFEMMDCIGI